MKKPIDYQSEVQEALEFLNSARQAPASIIPELVKMMGKFKGNNYMIEPNVQLQTNEGVKAVEDAITFLSTQKAVKPYQIGEKFSPSYINPIYKLLKLFFIFERPEAQTQISF